MPTGWAFQMFAEFCSFNPVMFRYHISCRSACVRQNNRYHISFRGFRWGLVERQILHIREICSPQSCLILNQCEVRVLISLDRWNTWARRSQSSEHAPQENKILQEYEHFMKSLFFWSFSSSQLLSGHPRCNQENTNSCVFTSKASTQWKAQPSMTAFNQAESERPFLPELINTWLQRGFHMGRRHVPTKLNTPRDTLFSPAAYTHTKPQQVNIKGNHSTSAASLHNVCEPGICLFILWNKIIFHMWHGKSYVRLEVSSWLLAKQEMPVRN